MEAAVKLHSGYCQADWGLVGWKPSRLLSGGLPGSFPGCFQAACGIPGCLEAFQACHCCQDCASHPIPRISVGRANDPIGNNHRINSNQSESMRFPIQACRPDLAVSPIHPNQGLARFTRISFSRGSSELMCCPNWCQ